MKKLKKLFGEINMSWVFVIVFAIITAIYTALINQVPILEDTSFRDIAIYPECWLLFAVFIIVNCKNRWEAALKCFVFFLVSQPLIYLIEVPFSGLGWHIFGYYKYWFVITLLTLPGAAIAFLLKRKDWISVLVLSVATGFLAYMTAMYTNAAITNFPRHLLSAVFCMLLILLFSYVIFDKRRHKAAVICVSLIIFATSLTVINLKKPADVYLDSGNWSYTAENDSIVGVEIRDGNHVIFRGKKDGSTYVYFTDDEGNKDTYYITVSGGGVWQSRIDE